jgi:hypothetical protein
MNFDYIIVGAGSAGCVLANRLSADARHRVLLLEAGPADRSLWIHLPIGYGKTMFHPAYNWGFHTEPDPGMNGRRIYWPRGRGLGGSSSINGLIYIRGQPEIVKAEESFLKGTLRLDIFGIKTGGTIDAPLFAALRPKVPALKPGGKYLLEVVLRTTKLGHPFTQGTVDSNEVWADAEVSSGGKIVGRSGGLGAHREVDPWAHFVTVYMLDRDGNRIDRRNPQDIFTPLYNHQIPPGAAQIVHYELAVPDDQREPLKVQVKLQYRKFDTIYMNYVYNSNYAKGAPLTVTNDLPIVTMASDQITFPIEGQSQLSTLTNQNSTIPEWQRWNDYGIGLLLESTDRGAEKGELIQAAQAFEQVEKLGRADGPINLARVFFKEGRLDDAVAALQRAFKRKWSPGEERLIRVEGREALDLHQFRL